MVDERRILATLGVLASMLGFAVRAGGQVPPDKLYLGQRPPGARPVLFAPGIVSTDLREHSAPVFSADGGEVYFSRQEEGRHDILWSRWDGFHWTSPGPVPFSSATLDDGPALSPRDGRLYFGSLRLTGPGADPEPRIRLWVVDANEGVWGEATPVGGPVGALGNGEFPSFTADGTLYFHSDGGQDGGDADIYRARAEEGGFARPERLPEPINTPLYEAGAFISADESFILYMQLDVARPEAVRLNLSFRRDGDRWTDPVDLAEVLDLPRSDLLLGTVSPDKKYLFILAGGDVYWLDAGIIEKLRQKTLGRRPRENGASHAVPPA